MRYCVAGTLPCLIETVGDLGCIYLIIMYIICQVCCHTREEASIREWIQISINLLFLKILEVLTNINNYICFKAPNNFKNQVIVNDCMYSINYWKNSIIIFNVNIKLVATITTLWLQPIVLLYYKPYTILC